MLKNHYFEVVFLERGGWPEKEDLRSFLMAVNFAISMHLQAWGGTCDSRAPKN